MEKLIFLFVIGLILNFVHLFPVENDEQNLIDWHNLNIPDHVSRVPDPKVGELVAKWTPESGIPVEMLGTYYQGDILIPHQSRVADKRRFSIWPNATIPFQYSSTFSEGDQKVVNECMSLYHKNTCVKFVTRKDETDFVEIGNSDTGCYSYVGRYGGKQPVNLQSNGCVYVATACHELMHAIGFWHEQSRPDRDLYVKILTDKIEANQLHNFDKMKYIASTNYDVPYNYDSIMHYPASSFAITPGDITIEALRPGGELMGQRNEVQPSDWKQINVRYGCTKFLTS